MRNVAITGISGYIGNHLLQRLDEREEVESIIGVDRRLPKFTSPKLKFYSRSVQEPFGDILADNGVDSAIHLAFVVPPAKDRDAHGINIGGTRNFLEACQQASVRNLLYLSSHTVYGPHPDNPIPITEDRPLRPITSFPYSWDKAEADRMFQDLMESHPDKYVTIVRTCAVIGPTAGVSGFNVLLTPVMIRVMGYDPPWQFVYEDELVELLLALISQKQRGVFNAGGDGFIHYRDIITAAGKPSIALPSGLLSMLMTVSWRLHLQSSSPVGGLEFIKHPIILSTEKLKRTTGFQFKWTSRDALLSFLSPKVLSS